MTKFIFSFLLIALFTTTAASQSKDTLTINAKDINTKWLVEGEHRYLVYFKLAPGATRTNTNFWTRSIKRTNTNGRPTITVSQEWEDKDTIMHTVNTVCDARNMQTLTHQSWWKGRGEAAVDFEKGSIKVNAKELSSQDTASRNQAIWNAFKSTDNQFFLNWHLDLEVFPTLPFKNGRTFLIPFYDPATGLALDKYAYTVIGSAVLTGYDKKEVDCWVMTHDSKGSKEKFYISMKTQEVLKLEQEVNGKMWRYKIKLAFSE
ncbi:MAG: hypothetical protein EOO06_11660 [Chitinophagaceae bacterium]|nr:MAG: hypothetical protein EOO06_11660 [Chitinophagaceae bacterium]